MLWGDGPLGQSQSRGSDGEVHLSRMNAGKDGNHREPRSVPPWFPLASLHRENQSAGLRIESYQQKLL